MATFEDEDGQEVEVEVVSGPPPEQFKVAMLGATGVGKSSLTSQFLTSDHMNTYDNVGEFKFLGKSYTLIRNAIYSKYWTEI